MALRVLFLTLAALVLLQVGAGEDTRKRVRIPSSIDGNEQPAYVIPPPGWDGRERRPLVVSLHSWSNDLEQRNHELEAEAAARGWIYLFPNFRGVNDNPDACGSERAQQDIVDAAKWAMANYAVDPKRVYLTGSSGGGHMTLLVASRYPLIWAAASAWVPISDLVAWHGKQAQARYGEMIRKCCGGPPGANATVDRQYHDRSPLHYMAGARNLPLDIAAGVHDGHKGSVPIRQSLEAFNAVAKAVGGESVTEAEIEQLSRPDGHLEHPKPSDQVEDPVFGRAIYLRRTAGKARVTIFEGGHEGIAKAQLEFLSRFRKK